MNKAKTKKRILIVEDDPFIAMDLEDIFDASGFDVIGPFANVDAGLKALENTQPEFAMLDYNLGQETSIPLAIILEKKEIPYIFLSGQVAEVIFKHDILKRPIIAKPFVPEHLIRIVEIQLGKEQNI